MIQYGGEMDPYSVLGIPENASEEEIKRAYRKLIRIYHPDANVNNPDKDKAEEKFQEIQEAYDILIKEKQGRGYYYYSNRSSDTDTDAGNGLKAAANYIRAGYYKEALNALSGVPQGNRNGTWYFLAATASWNLGETEEARSYIDVAVKIEPGNLQFRQAMRQMDKSYGYEAAGTSWGGSYGNDWYDARSAGYGGREECGSFLRTLLDLLFFNVFCCFC